MKTFTLVLMAMVAITALLYACGESRSVNGEFMVDGTILKYENTVNLTEEYSFDSLHIEGGTLDVDLQGKEEPKMNLQIKYREYAPGDAKIYIDNGKIAAQTKSGKPMAITNVSGNIPNHLNLLVDTGTGRVNISNMAKANTATINTGTGIVSLTQCQLSNLSVKTGTGDVTLDNSKIITAEISTGTGNVILKKSQVEKQNFSMGTGDLIQE